MLKYCLDRYKTHNICKTFVDVYPMILRHVPDWFATPKMLEVLHNNIINVKNII